MITDQDITKLKTIFATKEDLEKYATKDDLDELRIDMNSGFHILSATMENMKVTLDYVAGKYREREQEDAIGSAVQARHGRQIEAIATYIELELPE